MDGLFQEEKMRTRNLSMLVACGIVIIGGLNLIGQDKPKSKKAPPKFQAKFETTAGDFVIEVQREWAPIGADRFYYLVNNGLYDGCKFFRIVPNFMVQFGIHGDPNIAAQWLKANLKDDPLMKSNKRGFVTFAKAGVPNSRTTQIFINYKDNSSILDRSGFAPFGQVVKGMDVVDKINDEYGEKPDQIQVQTLGNRYLESEFPNLDGIIKATIIDPR